MSFLNGTKPKTVTIVAADKLTQDGVCIAVLNKPYEVHHDDAIGYFIIGEKGVHGVISENSLDYYTSSSDYNWSLVIGACGI